MALITQNADSVGKCGQELGAIAILNFLSALPRGRIRFPFVNPGGDVNGLHDLEFMPLSITEKVLHPFGFQTPFRDQAVSGQATLVERSSGDRLIDAVTARVYVRAFDYVI